MHVCVCAHMCVYVFVYVYVHVHVYVYVYVSMCICYVCVHDVLYSRNIANMHVHRKTKVALHPHTGRTGHIGAATAGSPDVKRAGTIRVDYRAWIRRDGCWCWRR